MYAAQHATGRECVSRGSTAGRHVPAPRDGKNQSWCLFFSAVVTCSSGWVARQLPALRILIFVFKQSSQKDRHTRDYIASFLFQILTLIVQFVVQSTGLPG